MASENLPNMEMVYEIPMKLSAQLPLLRQSTQEILRLETGSLIELNELASVPVNLCLNNRPFARGEVVVIGGNLAVRITEMLVNVR